VEHYEIAGYGTARTLADQLGFDEAEKLPTRRSTRKRTPTSS
jgi:ferritin-like metal-binding protein YciE